MAESSEAADTLAAAMQVLEEHARRGRETLDGLPESPAGAIVELRHYDFMLARKRLAREKVANRHILMITDGEPTAHLENGRPFFSYPPSYRTIDETLREIRRCTRAGITINTFMLATNAHLMNFIDAMTKINRGRALYTTPDTLGRYVMADYLRDRNRQVVR
jgi:uncharacterized protein with von Willebrand factor type A (vWA) domain